jgi:hypothetical protein
MYPIPASAALLRRVALCLVASSAAATSFASAASPPAQSFDMQVPMAPTPFVIDGHLQLSYEVHLTNFATHALAISAIDVLDQRTGRGAISSFKDEALAALVGRPGRSDTSNDPRVIEPGARAVIYLDITLADGLPVPTGLRHRIAFDESASASHERALVEGGVTSVSAVPARYWPLPSVAAHGSRSIKTRCRVDIEECCSRSMAMCASPRGSRSTG